MLKQATLAGGCFWCVEAIFASLKGVERVRPGYSGGHIRNPSYKEVCTGRTGHAEVIHFDYDPAVIDYGDILEIFFHTHDPTTLNRQGNDVGTQYRSAIFYHDDGQREDAERIKDKLNGPEEFNGRIVTEIVPFENFYEAEDYHHDYFSQNPDQPYCAAVIHPKVKKFRSRYADRLK